MDRDAKGVPPTQVCLQKKDKRLGIETARGPRGKDRRIEVPS